MWRLLELLGIGRRVKLWSCFGRVHSTFLPRWRKPRWVHIYPVVRVGEVLLLSGGETAGHEVSFIHRWWYATDTPPQGLWHYGHGIERIPVDLRTDRQIVEDELNRL